MKGRWLIAPLLLAAGTAAAAPLVTVRTCRLDGGARISLLAEPGMDGNRFFLRIDGKVGKAFTDMAESDFVGTVALATCVDRVLVFAIRYGPPYLKGVAVRQNPLSHAIERIDFAEKALPRWLYLSPTAMQLIIPNIGREVSSKYLVYGLTAAIGQANEATALNALPDKTGFKVFRVK
jgi:hypothetical protein